MIHRDQFRGDDRRAAEIEDALLDLGLHSLAIAAFGVGDAIGSAQCIRCTFNRPSFLTRPFSASSWKAHPEKNTRSIQPLSSAGIDHQ